MTREKYNNLLRFASILGIKTAEDLMIFKNQRKASNNDELYLALYYAALSKIKSAPNC